MAADYTGLGRCLACDKAGLIPVLDLGRQPLANSYHRNMVALSTYPLAVNLCANCYHVQQAVAVNPDLMFKNYAYVSGTSQTLKDYFEEFVREVEARYVPNTKEGKSVLDIACNDGSQLVPFMARGWNAWGVDPAQNLIGRATEAGAAVLCDYWNVRTAAKLGRTFDIIIAQNVFAHVSDPKEFLDAAKLVMHPASKLIIQTSQADMIPHGEFDTIYHEHISFFSARSMQALAKRAGLTVEDIFIGPIHGGSYIFVLGFGGEGQTTKARLAIEEREGRYNMALYKQFALGARDIVKKLKDELQTLKASGHALVGFGAAAKGNTLLNFGQISLDYIIDENPLKQNLYTPGMNIPIYGMERLVEQKGAVAIVPLAWNFFDEIYRKAKAARPNQDDVFVTYFPQVTLRK